MVEFGGCHGFQYKFDLVEHQHQPYNESSTELENENETPLKLLPSPASSEANLFYDLSPYSAIGILLDATTFQMIHGSTLEYEKELIGSQFKILNNPNADHGCGCGVSFGLK